jgi:ferredoxin
MGQIEEQGGGANHDSGRPSVLFMPRARVISVEPGTTLLEAARSAGMPVAHSCGGFAICSWCRMQVLGGAENLSPLQPAEEKLARRQGFAPNERASCQAEVRGDVAVTTTYW